jgi:hypothetical protein
MRFASAALFAVLALMAAPLDARADNCAQAAASVAAQYGAEILAVRADGGMCVIKLRIPGSGGQPPRVETVTVPA